MKDRLQELRTRAAQNFKNDDVYQGDTITINIEEIKKDDVPDFFTQVEEIRNNVDHIADSVEAMKKRHSDILLSPKPDQKAKDELEKIMADVKQTAIKVRGKLKILRKNIDSQEKKKRKDGTMSTNPKMQIAQHSALSQRFVEVMTEYNNTQTEYRERCKNRIKRQLEITGRTTSDEELEDMIESGNPAIFASVYIMDTQQAKQALGDIEARYNDIMKLEKNIRELHDMFTDMAMLVGEQGEMIDRVEYNVERSVHHVENARDDIERAEKCLSKIRKRKLLIAFCILLLIGVIVLMIALSLGLT